jgi:hypothetical protein
MMAFKPKNAFLAFFPVTLQLFFFQFSLKPFQVMVSNAQIEQNTPYVYIDFPLKMHICLILMIID